MVLADGTSASDVWVPLTGTLIGGIVALAGVLISQRMERKKAHDDRVWQPRVEVYARVYEWAGYLPTFVAGIKAKLIKPDFTVLQVKKLNAVDEINIALYGSRAVSDAYEKCKDYWIASWVELQKLGPTPEKDTIVALVAQAEGIEPLAEALRQTILRESRGEL